MTAGAGEVPCTGWTGVGGSRQDSKGCPAPVLPGELKSHLTETMGTGIWDATRDLGSGPGSAPDSGFLPMRTPGGSSGASSGVPATPTGFSD